MPYKNICYQLAGLISISVIVLIIYCSVPKSKIFRNKCGGGVKIFRPELIMKQYDHIILASNVTSFNETNTHSHFKTRLAQKKVFPSNEDWRVALTEITYKQSWYNIREDCPIHLIYQDGMNLKIHELVESLKIEAGFYPNIDYLIKAINTKLQMLTAHVTRAPHMHVHPESRRIFIYPGITNNSAVEPGVEQRFIPVFNKDMENILGLVDKDGCTLSQKVRNIPMDNSTHKWSKDIATNFIKKKEQLNYEFDRNKIRGSYPADINAGFNNLYIYSNIVQQSHVGDAYGEILTTVPNKLSKDGFGGSVIHEPKNLVYRPLQTRTFDTIEIDITDDSGKEIPFKLGNTVVKLEFVRYE